MSVRQRQSTRDLVKLYGVCLERQIMLRGSSLASQDQELVQQAEELLADGDALEMHCLGVDPLRVVEESLKASSEAAGGRGRRVRPREGLQGLAKAFEVLEQAAVNLYLGPWREEYQVIKTYSGTFTHCISSVLSGPQIQVLFGLLGYRRASSRPDQLRRQPASLGAAAMDDLLRLACAFFLARCECRLLLAALGKHGGDAQWEMNLVRERQRGHSLEVSVDNTSCSLGVVQPLVEALEGEVDLYGAELENGQHPEEEEEEEEEEVAEEAPRSLTWINQSQASPHNLQSSSRNRATTSSLKEPEIPPPSLSHMTTTCSCLDASHLCLKRCADCSTLHDMTCPSLEVCSAGGHILEFAEFKEKQQQQQEEEVVEEEVEQEDARSEASNLALRGEPDPPALPLLPMSFHDCCSLSQPDPRLLCLTCSVFHAASCMEKETCEARHDTQQLGVCPCGRPCPRNPLVLCRYCGKELCKDCWYREPLTCSCGQTFDQSSPV